MADMTVIILTKNEEMNIRRCIESARPIAKRIVVVDSYSTDATLTIAQELGADILQHEFLHYGAQFQWALDHADIQTKWVFRLDADEEVSPASREEIEKLCRENADTDVNGFVFRLQNIFLGRSLKHGVLHTLQKLCIFKNGKAYMENRSMGEHLVLTEGTSIAMKSLSFHHEVRSISFMMQKFNWYSTREVEDFLAREKEDNQPIANMDRPTRIRRFIKYKVYSRLPVRLRSHLLFIYYYWLCLGFLDGIEGFYWNFFQVYYYRLLVDAKLLEARRSGERTADGENPF